MATLTEIINDPSIPAHLREQIAQAQIDTIQQEAESVPAGDSELAELVGGKIKLTHEHKAGTGKMIVYDSDTGEPREILQYMAAKTLLKKRAGGKPAFTTVPLKEYVQGNVMCYLHPDHPDREALRAMGLDETKDCGYNSDRPPSAHLASEYDRDQHMEHRHNREWNLIKSVKVEQERREQVEIQREQVEAMKAMARAAMGNGLVVSPDDCEKCATLTGGPLVMHQRSHRGA